MIGGELIRDTVVELLRMAVTDIRPDIEKALQQAFEREEDPVPRMQLKAILDNVRLAEEVATPMCQDTGVPLFYVTLGKPSVENVEGAVRAGVEQATRVIPLRPNTVDPLTRKNPGTNVGERMPYINYKVSTEDYIEITALPKGAGSENMSALAMLNPAQGVKGVKEFVLNTILKSGGKPCPPTIVGVGIGGSADIAMKLAKEATLRPMDQRHREGRIAALEEDLYEALNGTGIGPMGMGGKTTVLGVNIEYADCHTASLPVAINLQCWAARQATARIHGDGRVEYMRHGRR